MLEQEVIDFGRIVRALQVIPLRPEAEHIRHPVWVVRLLPRRRAVFSFTDESWRLYTGRLLLGSPSLRDMVKAKHSIEFDVVEEVVVKVIAWGCGSCRGRWYEWETVDAYGCPYCDESAHVRAWQEHLHEANRRARG